MTTAVAEVSFPVPDVQTRFFFRCLRWLIVADRCRPYVTLFDMSWLNLITDNTLLLANVILLQFLFVRGHNQFNMVYFGRDTGKRIHNLCRLRVFAVAHLPNEFQGRGRKAY